METDHLSLSYFWILSPLIPSILLLFVFVLQAQDAPPIREAVDDQSPLKMKRGATKSTEKDHLDLSKETESKNKRERDDQSPSKMMREFNEKDLNDESKKKREAAPQGCKWIEGVVKCYSEDEGKLMKLLGDI